MDLGRRAAEGTLNTGSSRNLNIICIRKVQYQQCRPSLDVVGHCDECQHPKTV
jgi:hypothetical protein